MCFCCSCNLIVFLIVMIWLFVGMNDDSMLSIVVLLVLVLLEIRMLSCVCMYVSSSCFSFLVMVFNFMRLCIWKGLVVNLWIVSDEFDIVSGGMIVFMCDLLGSCVLMRGDDLLMCCLIWEMMCWMIWCNCFFDLNELLVCRMCFLCLM